MYTEFSIIEGWSDVDNSYPWEVKSAFQALVQSMNVHWEEGDQKTTGNTVITNQANICAPETASGSSQLTTSTSVSMKY